MISVLSIAMLTQLLLVLSGLALLQTVNFRQRISFAEMIPWAYGVGAVLLFLGGGLFVKMEWLPHHWHWIIASGMIALIAVGAAVYLRAQPTSSPESTVGFPLRWYDGLIIALILVKISLVTYICMINSVIDSDATYINGYMSLAKKIGENVGYSEVMTRSGLSYATSPVGPPLLAAWVRLFLDRWHDSVVTLPWLLAWAFSGYAAFVVCHRLTRHLTASLICAWLLLSLPLVTTHVFRSGFIDLLVAYFFACGVGVLSLALMTRVKAGTLDPAWLAAAAVAIAGTAMCKSEGKMWALFLTVLWVNYYLHAHRDIPWKQLLLVQVGLGFAAFAVYWLFMDAEFFKRFDDVRIRLMAPRAPEHTAFLSTLLFMYQVGSFNLLWWAGSATGTYLLVSRGVTENTKAMVLFVFVVMFAIIYFANFTENIKFTLRGTNVSRFLVQVSGLIIPLYCSLALAWLPTWDNNAHASDSRPS